MPRRGPPSRARRASADRRARSARRRCRTPSARAAAGRACGPARPRWRPTRRGDQRRGGRAAPLHRDRSQLAGPDTQECVAPRVRRRIVEDAHTSVVVARHEPVAARFLLVGPATRQIVDGRHVAAGDRGIGDRGSDDRVAATPQHAEPHGPQRRARHRLAGGRRGSRAAGGARGLRRARRRSPARRSRRGSDARGRGRGGRSHRPCAGARPRRSDRPRAHSGRCRPSHCLATGMALTSGTSIGCEHPSQVGSTARDKVPAAVRTAGRTRSHGVVRPLHHPDVRSTSRHCCADVGR